MRRVAPSLPSAGQWGHSRMLCSRLPKVQNCVAIALACYMVFLITWHKGSLWSNVNENKDSPAADSWTQDASLRKHERAGAALGKPDSVKKSDFAVFVMTLPEKYNADCVRKVAGTEDLSVDGVGSILDESDDHRLRHTSHFALEVIFHQRLLKSKWTTEDPRQADAVYIPYYASLMATYPQCRPGLTESEMEDQLVEHVQKSAEWGQLRGNRHFMALGKTENFFLQGERCSSNSKTSLRGRSSLRCIAAFKDVVFIVPEPANTLFSVRLTTFASRPILAPYPSWVHFEHKNEKPLPFAKDTERNILVVSAFDVDVQDGYNRQLRHELRQQLEEKGPQGASIFYNIKEDGQHDLDWEVRLLEVMRHAVFFLHPPGDSVINLKYFFDSILLGAIPVVMMPSLADMKAALPFSDTIDYSQLAVHIPTKSILSNMQSKNFEIKTHLSHLMLATDKIKAYRKYQKQVSHFLQYSLMPSAGVRQDELKADAFDLVMKKVVWKIGRKMA